MFHRKPLYVSIAQRKEERQAHLQMHYAQRPTAIFGQPSTVVVPGGYRPEFVPASPGSIAPCHSQSTLMYHQPPMRVRPGWRGNSFAPAARPAFQASRTPSVSSFHQHWIPCKKVLCHMIILVASSILGTQCTTLFYRWSIVIIIRSKSKVGWMVMLLLKAALSQDISVIRFGLVYAHRSNAIFYQLGYISILYCIFFFFWKLVWLDDCQGWPNSSNIMLTN